MKLQYHHKGKKVKRPEWAKDQWYEIREICGQHIIVKDQDGGTKVIDRNDEDTNWELKENV